MARLRGASIPTLPMSQSTQSLSPRRDYHSQILTSHHLKVRQNMNYYILNSHHCHQKIFNFIYLFRRVLVKICKWAITHLVCSLSVCMCLCLSLSLCLSVSLSLYVSLSLSLSPSLPQEIIIITLFFPLYIRLSWQSSINLMKRHKLIFNY